MVLPQLHIGVGFVFKFRAQAKGYSLLIHRQNGAGSKVNAYAPDLLRSNLRLFQNRPDGGTDHLYIILRVLKRKERRQLPAGGQTIVHNTMGIAADRLRHLLSVAAVHQDASAG